MNMHNLELKLENNLLKTWEKQMIKMIKYIIHFISEINIKIQLNKNQFMYYYKISSSSF